MTGRLQGKIAIITGAGRGQGEAEARLFAAEGAKVVLVDLLSSGQDVADEIGPDAVFVRADVSDEAGWSLILDRTHEAFGPPTALVNNAAIYDPHAIQDTDPAGFDRHYRVNQRGVFLGMSAVIEPMTAAGGGSIVNISSIAGMRGVPQTFAYSATKWAVRGMTKSAALDLASVNIRVNSVQPGAIETPMLDGHGADIRDALRAMTPLGRVALPIEVARAVLFLASDEASFVTGAELTVSGGA